MGLVGMPKETPIGSTKTKPKKGDRDWERGVRETDENNVGDYSNLSDPVPSPLPFPVYES